MGSTLWLAFTLSLWILIPSQNHGVTAKFNELTKKEKNCQSSLKDCHLIYLFFFNSFCNEYGLLLGSAMANFKRKLGQIFLQIWDLEFLITASFLGCVLYTGTLFTGLVTQTTYDVNK